MHLSESKGKVDEQDSLPLPEAVIAGNSVGAGDTLLQRLPTCLKFSVLVSVFRTIAAKVLIHYPFFRLF